MDWTDPTARRDEKHLSIEIWCDLYYRFDGKHTTTKHRRTGSNCHEIFCRPATCFPGTRDRLIKNNFQRASCHFASCFGNLIFHWNTTRKFKIIGWISIAWLQMLIGESFAIHQGGLKVHAICHLNSHFRYSQELRGNFALSNINLKTEGWHIYGN